MTNRINDVSQRNAGITAGVGVFITLAGVAVAVSCGAPPNLNIPGDAAATARKIIAAGGLFRVAIIGWLFAILGDVVRAWALYVFFRPVNKSVAMLSAWWMLLHDAVFAGANVSLVVVSELLGGMGAFASLAPQQTNALMMLFLEANNYGFMIGLFFFSFHLLLIGYLVLRSGFVPRILGILATGAGIGYLIDSAGRIFTPAYPPMLTGILAAPNTIGELALMVWLAFRGGKAPTKPIKKQTEGVSQ